MFRFKNKDGYKIIRTFWDHGNLDQTLNIRIFKESLEFYRKDLFRGLDNQGLTVQFTSILEVLNSLRIFFFNTEVFGMQRSSKWDKKDPQILTNEILCGQHEEQVFDSSINHVHAIHEGVQIFCFPT